MRFVIFYCILFWANAPIQTNDDMMQSMVFKNCDSTIAQDSVPRKAKAILHAKLKKIKEVGGEVKKIDTIKIQ
jgi:hypothetical protein